MLFKLFSGSFLEIYKKQIQGSGWREIFDSRELQKNKGTKYHKTNGHSSQNIAFKERGYVLLDNFSLLEENTETTHSQQSSKDTVPHNLVFENVTFGFDQEKYNQNAIPMLELILDSLKNNPDFKIDIYGYTDSVGTYGYNQHLSEMRAKNISKYLLLNGIEKKRINYKKALNNPLFSPSSLSISCCLE